MEISISDIKAIHKSSKLVPFIGAGLSMDLGLPNWNTLISVLAHGLGWDPNVFNIAGYKNPLQLAEYYSIIEDPNKLVTLLTQNLTVSDENITASKVHELLVKLSPKLIYTTNFDQIIEKAFGLRGQKVNIIKSINDLYSLDNNLTSVIKFHGDITSPPDEIVFTETSFFERLRFESELDIRLRSDTLSNTLLFMGYSINDINVRYILYKLHKMMEKNRKTKNSPIAILAAFQVTEIQKTLLDAWNIGIYKLDPVNKTESTVKFLEELI